MSLFWAILIQCLICEKACSIGLRSGEYLGRNQSLAPAVRIAWLAGDEFSLADMAYAPYAVRLDQLQLSGLWTPDSRFADWYDRVRARHGFRTGIADWFNDKYLALMAEKGAEVWPQVKATLAA